jgi:FixJ family two-component response regulator
MELVYLVDDDPAITLSLGRVLRAEGWEVETFDSAEAFLARSRPEGYGCLVLDVSMPGLDGLELQVRLHETGQSLPIVFLTGDADIPMSVQAIKAGAADFLTKPVTPDALAHAVRTAFDNDAADRVARAERATLERRLAALTGREREVLVAVAKGRLNKQIAGDLGIVEQTVKFHRARIMERTQARTAAELMNIAATLGIH